MPGPTHPDFGDDEPEDGYHPDDAPDDIVRNLLRRLVLLERTPRDTSDAIDVLDALALIEVRTRFFQRRALSERDRLRVRQLLEDIATLRGRLDG